MKERNEAGELCRGQTIKTQTILKSSHVEFFRIPEEFYVVTILGFHF